MALDWRSLFSGSGRIDRTTFWTVQLLLALFQACLKATATLFPSVIMLGMLAPFLIAAWVVSIFNLVKRCHDLGRSGCWLLVPATIVVLFVGLAAVEFGQASTAALAAEDLALLGSLVIILAIGGLKGNAGPNRFGEPPKALSSPAV